MSSEQLVRNCAPTLAGIKTGSLYAIHGADIDELKELSYLLESVEGSVYELIMRLYSYESFPQ